MIKKIIFTLLFISSSVFATAPKNYIVGARSWMVKNNKIIDIPIDYDVSFNNFKCTIEERFLGFKYGLAVVCKENDSDVVFSTEAVCSRSNPGEEFTSNITIITDDTVTINVECRTTNRKV